MVSLDDLKALAIPAQTKIVLLVLDGLGSTSLAWLSVVPHPAQRPDCARSG